jgi:hypothetical protein
MKTINDILVSNLNGEFAAAIEATGREVNGSDGGPGAIGEYHSPQTPGPLSSGGANLALLETLLIMAPLNWMRSVVS